MLFDLFEKQLDVPATFVKLGDDQSRKLEVVGEKAETLLRFLVIENDITQILRMVVRRSYAGGSDGLIAARVDRFIDGPRNGNSTDWPRG